MGYSSLVGVGGVFLVLCGEAIHCVYGVGNAYSYGNLEYYSFTILSSFINAPYSLSTFTKYSPAGNSAMDILSVLPASFINWPMVL